MKKLIIIIITQLSLLSTNAVASVFCVLDSIDIQEALDIASSNNQSDHIKIAAGTYQALSGTGFDYAAGENENFDLKISGGWTMFMNDPCGQSLAPSAFSTVLDGLSQELILKITLDDDNANANIEISRLSFNNGFVGTTGGGIVISRGAGLYIATSNGYVGDVVVENNVFTNNYAKEGSALYISRGNKIVVRNNLFVENDSLQSNTVYINQNNAFGIYFTNNTLYYNDTDDTKTDAGAGLYLLNFGSSQAFIANNVFWGNDASDLRLGGDGYKYLRNNDIGIQIGEIADEDLNNFSLNPWLALDYSPAFFSPLLNAGITPPEIVGVPPAFDDAWILGNTDVIANDRILFGNVDIGAIEYSSELIFKNGFEGPQE